MASSPFAAELDHRLFFGPPTIVELLMLRGAPTAQTCKAETALDRARARHPDLLDLLEQ